MAVSTPVSFASDPKIPKLGPLKIAYLGRLSHSDQERSLTRLLATLSVWQVNTSSKPNEIEFHFYGTYGASDQLQLQKLRALGFGVYLNEALPREKLAEKSSSFDGGLVISSPKQTGSTSKLLDYLGLRLPIFAIAPEGSHIHSIIATSGCGHMIDFTDKTDHAAKQWENFILGIRSRTLVVNEDTRAAFLPSPNVEAFVDELFSF